MAEPTTITTIAALSALLSAITVALFGIDYYSLLYGFVGAMIALSRTEPMGRTRAVVFCIVSTLAGAVLGHWLYEYAGTASKTGLMLACVVGGLVSQTCATAILDAAPKILEGALKKLRSK